jgi:hypothetical protein
LNAHLLFPRNPINKYPYRIDAVSLCLWNDQDSYAHSNTSAPLCLYVVANLTAYFVSAIPIPIPIPKPFF